MGIVQEVGSEVTNIAPGDRVVIPFNIFCGHCYPCEKGLQSQCETTQVREYENGAALLGYTKLYGQVPGGQAEFLRVPQAHYGDEDPLLVRGLRVTALEPGDRLIRVAEENLDGAGDVELVNARFEEMQLPRIYSSPPCQP